MKTFAISFLLAATSTALSATEDHPCTFGIETFFSTPSGALCKLYTPSTGKGTGLFLEWNFGKGHGLRADLGVETRFPRRDKIIQGAVADSALSSSCTTVSYTFHPAGEKRGPYLSAGIGMKHFEASFDTTPGAGPTTPVDPILTHNRHVAETGQKFAWVVGGGYHFNLPVGLTLRCVGTQAMGHTLTTLEAGINVRF